MNSSFCDASTCGAHQICEEGRSFCVCTKGFVYTGSTGCTVQKVWLDHAWGACLFLACLDMLCIFVGVCMRKQYEPSKRNQKSKLYYVVLVNALPASLVASCYYRRSQDEQRTIMNDFWIATLLANYLCFAGVIVFLTVVKYCEYLRKKQTWIVKDTAFQKQKTPRNVLVLGGTLCGTLKQLIQSKWWNQRFALGFILLQELGLVFFLTDMKGEAVVVFVCVYWLVFLPYILVLVWFTTVPILKDYDEILAFNMSNTGTNQQKKLVHLARKAKSQLRVFQRGTCIYSAIFTLNAFLNLTILAVRSRAELIFVVLVLPVTLILQMMYFLLETSKRIRGVQSKRRFSPLSSSKVVPAQESTKAERKEQSSYQASSKPSSALSSGTQ